MAIPHIWLASSSPRRQQILGWTGLKFKILPTDIDESVRLNETGENYVKRLAEEKARKAADNVMADNLVIAADTTVVLDRVIFGKPADCQEAINMLTSLRNKQHEVITAIVAYQPHNGSLLRECCVSPVRMRAYTDQEMLSYVDSGDALDKAGAYAIQHPLFDPVTDFHGCYASVMGLPLCHLERALCCIEGYERRDMPQICQNNLGYTCPIYTQVMNGENVG